MKKNPKERIVIHCAAGIHRTGVFAYSVLRGLGYSATNAMSKILELRKATHRGVGADRVRAAEDLIVPKVIEMLKKGVEVLKEEEEEQEKNEEDKKI